MSSLSICYVIYDFSTHIDTLFTWMREHGVRVGYITFHQPKRTDVKSYFIPPQKNFYSKLRLVKADIKMEKPHILHAHQVIGHGMWGALSGFHPLVVSAWGSDVEILARQSFINCRIAKYVLKKADVVHVPAKCMIETVVRLGCPREKIFQQVFGTNTTMFSPDAREETHKRKYGASHIVTSIRVLGKIYSVETLIQASSKIVEKFPDAKIIILGDGDQKAALMELTKKLGLAKNVIFVGWRERAEIPAFLASSDVYVDTLASSAGISIGLLEAMSCGVPPVVARIPGVDEAIINGENGIIVKPRDPTALANAIISLLEDDSRRKAMGMAARSTAVRIGDLDKCMGNILSMYESLLRR